MSTLLLSLRENVSIAPGSNGELVLQGQESKFSFKHVAPGLRAALEQLAFDGACKDELTDTVLCTDGPQALPRLYYFLNRLMRSGMVVQSAQQEGKRLASLMAISDSFVPDGTPVVPDHCFALSRFTYMHRLNNKMVLESPLSHARLTVHDWRTSAVIELLAAPCRLADAITRIPELSEDAAKQLLTLLVIAGMAQESGGDGKLAEDDEYALQIWEFHDLLFHARCRTGRHDYPVGGTYRFAGRLDPPPALKPAVSSETVALFRPELEELRRLDPPYLHVQETRQSIREYGDPPINARQLGEFLYRVGRVKEQSQHEIQTANGPLQMDIARRPYPSGGALYELELYIVVNACTDLAAGVYHYDPLAHRLESISSRTPEFELLLRSAWTSTSILPENIQVLIVIAARFQRFAWKYTSVAYAVILKNVGVLYQSMYLAATAMGLAPCAIGCGNSDVFARAAGTDYYTESSVGEFLIGSKKT